MPVAPQPPHVAAEGLGEQCERRGEGDQGHGPRQYIRGRDGQHDALRRRDGLAPVARRQRLAHPRKWPLGDEERVTCRADREHPRAARAGDVHAEDEDQERIDLTVELRAQTCRPRASRHPSVDRVQRERDRRQRHQHRDRPRVAERVRHQRSDADGERRSDKGHPIGRGEPVDMPTDDTRRQCRIHDRRAGDPDDPAAVAEADGLRQHGEQQRLGDQAGRRARVSRPCGPPGAGGVRLDRCRRGGGCRRGEQRAMNGGCGVFRLHAWDDAAATECLPGPGLTSSAA